MVDPIVELDNGLARGVREKHEDGFDYYAFKGIPYAEPPIGELRFEDPVPKANWTGILDCKNYGKRCLQYDYFTKTSCSNEDCLFLNVFTRRINDKNSRSSVMIVIHGGSYLYGSGCDYYYGPEHLIRKDVVLVTLNYRLGVLGFLNLEDDVAPGNQGLKDQLLAMQWVQRNIRVFGGDPDNITVLGISAGAVCAHFLSMSPLSKGLFNKIIFQGATVQNAWSYVASPKRNAMKLCLLLGNELIDSKEILRFLKSVDAKRLQAAQEYMRISSLTLPFTPAIDIHSRNPVITIHPEIAAQQGIHYPCIVGYNSCEATILLQDDILFSGMTRREFFELCNKDITLMLKYNTENQLYRYNVSKEQLKRFYYGDEVISEENIIHFLELATDMFFKEANHRFIKVQMDNGSAATYAFVFNYDPPDSIVGSIVKDKPKGAGHIDELPYIFKMRIFESLGLKYFEKGTKNYRVMEQMTEMWTNFAKYGKPTIDISDLIPVHWQPVRDATVIRYLNIDEDITMESEINFERKLPSKSF